MVFVALWNQIQGQSTPAVHFDMASWLQDMRRAKNKRLLLMAFRGCGKSTLIGLFAAWLLFRNPNTRILVVAAEEDLAQKMVRNIRRIIERHPLTLHMKPSASDQWSADRFTVTRSRELRDPSVTGRGISANMTGTRADVIICDDVEVPNTSATTGRRAELRLRLGETDFILTPQGMKLFIGTPHTYHSIYSEDPAADHEDEAPYLNGYARLSIPLLNAYGLSNWPERFLDADMAALQRETGPNRFMSQMMLQPVNILNGRLDPAQVQIYEGGIAYLKELDRLEIENTQMVGAAAWWDPAFGREGGDRSVLAVVFTDVRGHYWLHHLEQIQIGSEEKNPAKAQCKIVADILKKLRVPSVSIETNGLGGFLPSILRLVLSNAHVPCSVLDVTSRKAKEVRIMEAFDVVLASQMLHVHRDVMRTPFATELREWRPGSGKGHDDCLDAVAGAISVQPARLGSAPVVGRPSWRKNTRAVQARTDFNI